MNQIAVVQPPEDRTVPSEYVGTIEPNYFCRAWNSKRRKYCRQRAGFKTSHVGFGRCNWHDGEGRIKHGIYSRTSHIRLGPLLDELAQQTPAERMNPFPELDLTRALLADWIGRFEEYAEALVAWYRDHEVRQRPIPGDRVEMLLAVLDEYEDCRCEHGELGETEQKRLEDCRSFVKLLGTPNPHVKPRKILDITTLASLLDMVSKQIHRIHQAASVNSIPRRRYLDVMTEIGRVINEEVSSPRELERVRSRIREIRI